MAWPMSLLSSSILGHCAVSQVVGLDLVAVEILGSKKHRGAWSYVRTVLV